MIAYLCRLSPLFAPSFLAHSSAQNVRNVFDFMDMDDAERRRLLGDITPTQLRDISDVCNRSATAHAAAEKDGRGGLSLVDAG